MINYYLLTKPGIILGNLIPLAAGFLLASKGAVLIWLFLATLIGLALIMASGCVFNNFIDRKMDEKMIRTKNRALVLRSISTYRALLFGTILGILGMSVLFFYTNLLTVALAAFGFFVYVVIYSLWKGRTVYGTAIGSVAGAIPPVVGYCAVSNTWDAGASILFAMMVLWQMPHFFAIALLHLDDYAKAGIPVLPLEKGILRTKIHMALYVCGFTGVALLLTLFHYTGYIYLAVVLSAGLSWFWLALDGFKRSENQRWGRQMFLLSLLILTSVCLTIPFDLLLESSG